MPQSVTFDIGNGILNVSAKDLGTGKKRDHDHQLVGSSKRHRTSRTRGRTTEDKQRREEIEVKNQPTGLLTSRRC